MADFTGYDPNKEQAEKMTSIVVAALNELGHASWIGEHQWIKGSLAVFAPSATPDVIVQAVNIARMAVGLPTFVDASDHFDYILWCAERKDCEGSEEPTSQG